MATHAPSAVGEEISFRENPEYSHTFAGRPRIEPLTGIRWFAALAVFLSHFPLRHAGPLHTFCLSGYMGVTVFFVLSGFILTVTYQERLKPTAASVWNFGVARLARVYPVYLLVLAYVLLTDYSGGVSLRGWWMHVLALQAWSSDFATTYTFNGPAWSVGVEFFLYACFPMIVFFLSPHLRSARASLALAAAVVLVLGLVLLLFYLRGLDSLPRWDSSSSHRWLYQAPLFRLGDFLLGVASANLYLCTRHRRPASQLTIIAEVALVTSIVAMMCSPSLFGTAGSYDAIYAIPGAALLYFVATSPTIGLGWFLALPLIVALGEASYAFYLIHEPIGRAIGESDFENGTTATTLVLYLMRIGVIAILAWGIHVAVERPARGLVRRSLSIRSPR